MKNSSWKIPQATITILWRQRSIVHHTSKIRLWTRAQSTMTEASAPKRRLNNSAIFVCDLQENFRNAIHEFDKLVLTTKKVLRAAEALQIPIYVTTQNRARLGDTVSELAPFLAPSSHPSSGGGGGAPLCRAYADKTIFSMWIPALTSQLPSSSSPVDIVLLGIESHICITQTALDAKRAGHRVYVLADGVSSCNSQEVPIALARLRAEGVTVTTSESWLYEVVGDAGLPEFKKIIGIVKDTKQDTKNALAALLPVQQQGESKI